MTGIVFSSITFTAFFLPLLTALYFISRNTLWRNAVLMVFSLLFYAWGEPVWVIVMIGSVIINWLCAQLIGRSQKQRAKRLWMLLGVTVSLAALFYFKYYSFLLNSLFTTIGIAFTVPKQTLPIGISFYTFQILTYTIDVYKGKVGVQKSLLRLMLYISFFPQLIAGPIVNYKDVECYLGRRDINTADFHEGLMRFITGFSKKVLIANLCGELLSKLTLTEGISVLGAWLGAISFSLQIYFDFSGYSDMAIGMGRMFDFHFLENFNYPYISSSITEFWRRWHISLGSFFREYVYIPLGGNRKGRGRQIINLLIVWSLTGLWHGAAWNFVVWGLYYGILLVIEKLIIPENSNIKHSFLGHIYTLFFVLIGWILFYHESLYEGMRHIGALFGVYTSGSTDPMSIYCVKQYLGFLILGLFSSVPWKKYIDKLLIRKSDNSKAKVTLLFFRSVVLTALFLVSISFLVGQSYNPFLYFRF